MKSSTYYILLPLCIIMFLMVMFVGCGMREMDSKWCDRTISIDGIDSGAEWENARYFFEKEKVTVGLMNTENILYLRLSTYDQKLQRQLLALGFTIWFDEKGGGMGRRGGMGGGGIGGPVQEPLELQVKVDLAKNPAESAPKS